MWSYCFVTYDNKDDGYYALREMEGYEINGSKLSAKIDRLIKPVCFNFEEHGHCRFGEDCRYHHPQEQKEEKKEEEKPKYVEYTKPEEDYFRKAIMALPKEEVIEPKMSKAKKEVENGERSTSDSD